MYVCLLIGRVSDLMQCTLSGSSNQSTKQMDKMIHDLAASFAESVRMQNSLAKIAKSSDQRLLKGFQKFLDLKLDYKEEMKLRVRVYFFILPLHCCLREI